MKYKIVEKPGQCSYEEYDKEHFDKTGEMKDCGIKSTIKVGHKHICINHLPAVMPGDSNPEMEDHRPIKKIGGSISDQNRNKKDIEKGFKIIPFREDFIKLCKGEEVNIRQTGMFDSSENKPEKHVMTEEEFNVRHCGGRTEINPTETRCKICKGPENQPSTIDIH